MTLQNQSPDGLSGLSELMSTARDAAEYDPPRQVDLAARRTRRRRALLIVAAVLIVLIGSAGGYVGWALNAPLRAPAVTSQTPQVSPPAAAGIPLPFDGASAISVSGADEYLGAAASGTWLSSGTGEPLAIASISKLITALVILDARPLAGDESGPTITFSKADHDLYDKYYVMGATIAAMPTGSSMSLRDALATMLIPSACNYAEAVSTWAFGSQSSFLRATRDWLARQGLAGTTIVEPSGISPRNTSTASDLMVIGKLAAANPVIAKIAATPVLSLPGPGAMVNTNDLLGQSGITGLKSGNLGENSSSLLYTATLDVGTEQPLQVTGVILGGFSRNTVGAGVLGLLAGIRDGFHDVPLAKKGDEVGTFTTAWGSSARMVLERGASIFTWSDTPITATLKTATPRAYAHGEVVGTLTWSAGPKTVSVDVVIDGSIHPPTAWWRLTHPGELGER